MASSRWADAIKPIPPPDPEVTRQVYRRQEMVELLKATEGDYDKAKALQAYLDRDYPKANRLP